MANDQAISGLVRVRSAIGVGAWVAPRISGRLFGLDVPGNPQAPYLARLFGVRDAALAYGLQTTQGAERAHWLKIGIACDLADALAGVFARRRRELPAFASVLVTAAALGAAALGVAALQDEQA